MLAFADVERNGMTGVSWPSVEDIKAETACQRREMTDTEESVSPASVKP